MKVKYKETAAGGLAVTSSNAEDRTLLLREGASPTLEPFARAEADPQVMEYFPSCRRRAERRLRTADAEHFDRHGYGLLRSSAGRLGAVHRFVGLQTVPFREHFTPAVEVGLASRADAWDGPDGPKPPSRDGVRFGEAGLARSSPLRPAVNERSQAVMRKLGMHATRPRLQPPRMPDPPLAPHFSTHSVLYPAAG